MQIGLIRGAFDIAVHSLKDTPTLLPDGLALAAITEREDPEDVLLVHPAHRGCGGLAGLPAGAMVGTSSVRRVAIIKRRFPHLRVASIRGNLQTRLRKLDESTPVAAGAGAAQAAQAAARAAAQAAGGSVSGASAGAGGAGGNSRPGTTTAGTTTGGTTTGGGGAVVVHYDAIILAAAGVRRLGWESRIEAALPAAEFPYGVSQGSLGIECRADDALVQELVQHPHVQHLPSAIRCTAERAVMRGLKGGCQMAMGVVSTLQQQNEQQQNGQQNEQQQNEQLRSLKVTAWVLSEDGQTLVEAEHEAADGARDLDGAAELGYALARKLRDRGASKILGPEATLPRPITYSTVATDA